MNNGVICERSERQNAIPRVKVRLVQQFAQVIFNRLVDALANTVALRMVCSLPRFFDSPDFTQRSELTFEVEPLICMHSKWAPETKDPLGMKRLSDGGGSMIDKRYNNALLSEEINDRENITICTLSSRKTAFAALAIEKYNFVAKTNMNGVHWSLLLTH